MERILCVECEKRRLTEMGQIRGRFLMDLMEFSVARWARAIRRLCQLDER